VAQPHYKQPDWATKNLFNPFVGLLVKLGIGAFGSRVLEVRGRTSGEWRSTPVNLLRFDGADYLVAPRGQTQWVRNIRVAGGGRLRLGRRHFEFTAVELPDDRKPELLRAYLKRWKWEVGQFFDGIGPDASDDQLLTIAPKHPVFKVERS
jgi:deazaflavin-dependent oxidoreductase (nitroreductase family)